MTTPKQAVPINFLEEISNFIFASKYSRHNELFSRRETWDETVTRLESMHLKKYNFLAKEDKNKVKWAFDLVRSKRIVPSMRSLQFGGKAIETSNARGYNCAVRHIDSIRSFAEVMYLLLCGCGVGLGLSKFFLDRLPDLVTSNDKTGTIVTYVVEDDIEGWADSVEALLNCYFRNTPYTGRKIVFDYSRIRKKGALLKTSGGKAPGYKGLKNTHHKIKALLDHIIEDKHQTRVKSINAYDILMHCADAVLSGGVRRSATSVIFDKDDSDMIDAKSFFKVTKKSHFEADGTITLGGTPHQLYNGKVTVDGIVHEVCLKEFEYNSLKKDGLISWVHIYPQRARSNNSVLLLRDNTTFEEFEKIVDRTRQFGEPGFVFADHPHVLLNPCFEVSFIPVTEDGVCGVQFCNLTSMNGRLTDSPEAFKENAEAYAIIGTLQAGYTHFPYLSNTAKKLTEEEALLGCSVTGMMDNPKVLLDPKLQRETAVLINKVNLEWSKKININPAARTTLIKPEGTSSLILGTGSGIHAHHARRYFRRVQCNVDDPVYKFFKKANPKLCEPSVWSANKTDDVITFPIEISEQSTVKDSIGAIEHLKIIKSTQQNWVLTGTTEYNKKPITHNVSCTVIVQLNEWEEVIKYLYDNKAFFAAVALLPASGDKDYAQAPMEAITTKEDEERWGNILKNFSSVNYKLLSEDEDNTNLSQEGACFGGACQLVSV